MVIAELDRKETGGGGLCAGGGEWKTISERNSFSRCLTLLSGSQSPTDSTRKTQEEREVSRVNPGINYDGQCSLDQKPQ